MDDIEDVLETATTTGFDGDTDVDGDIRRLLEGVKRGEVGGGSEEPQRGRLDHERPGKSPHHELDITNIELLPVVVD